MFLFSSPDGEPRAECRRKSNVGHHVEIPESLDTSSDEELLSRFCDGEREAFGILLRRYERELYGYLRRYLGDSELAEDVFQNTFFQVHQKRGQYGQGRPFRPWLYTIATHQAIDALRRAGRHPTLSLDQRQGVSDDGEVRSLLELLETRGAGPVEAAQEKERQERVRTALEQLPDFMRQVVVLVYSQGLKYREAAGILEIPVGNVEVRLHV